SLQSQVQTIATEEVGELATGALEFDPYAVQPQDVPRRRPPLFQAFEDEGGLKDLGDVVTFPEEVEILAVRTESDPEPITKGEAFLYFFPTGRTQMAYITLRDTSSEEADTFTVIIQPLTGKVTVEDGHEAIDFPSDLLKQRGDLGEQAQQRRL